MLFSGDASEKLLEKEDSQVKIESVMCMASFCFGCFREAVTAIKSRIYKRESLILRRK